MARKDAKTKKSGWKQLKAPKTPTASLKLESSLSGPLYFVDSKGDGNAKRPVKTGRRTKEVKKSSTSISDKGRSDGLYDVWETASASNPTPLLNEWTRDTIAPAKQLRTRSSLLSEPLLAGSFSNSEVCHPGQSYNPSVEDRSKAVEVALEFCMKADKAELALENKLAQAKEAVFPDEKALDTDDDDDDSAVGVSRSITRAEDRRTQVQKNKRRRHLLEVRKSAKRKLNKKLLVQIDSAETIKKEIDQKKEDGTQTSRRSKTIRFGGHRLPEAFPDVLLSNEVGRGLQEFEARPGFLRDRYIRLQRKGLISTRKTTKTNKKKLIFKNCGRGVPL